MVCILLSLYKAQELQVMGNIEVNKGRTLLVITQVSSGLKKIHILIFSKYKYLHVKIATLAKCKILCHCWSNSLMANVWPCIASVYYLSGLAI